MQLHVEVALPGDDTDPIDVDVVSFDDIDRIAHKVAVGARRWLRSVDMRRGMQQGRIVLTATFTEGEAAAPARERKPRRRKKTASDGTE
jgi:hypothetical protein